MTLQSSGAISLGNVNVELGRSSTANISLGETAVRTLAGVSSGPISLSQLYGKSNGPTFTPVPGTYSYEDYYDISINVTCSETATWTWTKSGGGTVSIASGGTGTTLTFSVSAIYNSSSGTYATRIGTLYLTATVGGVGYSFTITLTAMGDL